METEYKDSPLGRIPKKWKFARIDEVCEILDSQRVPINSKERSKIKGNVPYYGANGIVDYINKYLFNEDLILLAEDGGNFEQFKTKPIAYKISGKSWINNHVHILRAKKGVHQDWVFYSLVHKDITSFVNPGTRSKLNQGDLRKIPIPMPPLPEQEKIAAILSSVDNAIQATKKVIEKTQRLKRGLMQQLLTKGIGHTEFKDSPLGRIPKEWEVKRLKDICEIIQDGTHFSPKSKDGKYMYITSKNIKPNYLKLDNVGYISEEEHKIIYRNCPVKKGDVLFTKDGTIGIAALNNINDEFSLLSSVVMIRTNSSLLNNHYLVQCILGSTTQKEIYQSLTGSALRRITLSGTKKLRIIVPPLPEQEKIATILSSVDLQIQQDREELNKLQRLKKGLMQQLLTGKIRVTVSMKG